MRRCLLRRFCYTVCFSFFAELFYKRVDSLNAYPAEGRLLVMCLVSLFNQSNRLEDVGYVIETADLSLQLLSIVHATHVLCHKEIFGSFFLKRDLACCVLKRDNMPPSHEETYELLAKDTKRLVSLVLRLLLVLIVIKSPHQQRTL